MECGWIKLLRSLLSWEWYGDSKMVHLFIHLLLSANHKDGSWRGILVKRGQLIFGRKKCSEQTGISERSIRTCLDKLKKTKELTIKATNKYSIITICNYDTYQVNEQATDQQTGKPPTSNRPVTDHKQEGEKEKKDKKEGKKPDFIGKILDQFCEAYLTATGNEYSILAPGKERAAIGKLLKLYKEKYPGAKSEDTLTSLRVYFDAVVVISDNWLRENMSPSIIISKFNEINNILKNGKNRGNSKGATDRELAEIIVKHFGNE